MFIQKKIVKSRDSMVFCTCNNCKAQLGFRIDNVKKFDGFVRCNECNTVSRLLLFTMDN